MTGPSLLSITYNLNKLCTFHLIKQLNTINCKTSNSILTRLMENPIKKTSSGSLNNRYISCGSLSDPDRIIGTPLHIINVN